VRVITVKVESSAHIEVFDLKQECKKYGDISTSDTNRYIFYIHCTAQRKLAGLLSLLNVDLESNEVVRYTVY
jgi:hypothetical protein